MRTKIRIGNQELETIHAYTPEDRTRGLMHVDELNERVGMLFHFDEPTTAGFWMLDTKIPLDIAFIRDGQIIDIQSMEPYSLENCSPHQAYNYALEVRKGFFNQNGIKLGDTIQF